MREGPRGVASLGRRPAAPALSRQARARRPFWSRARALQSTTSAAVASGWSSSSAILGLRTIAASGGLSPPLAAVTEGAALRRRNAALDLCSLGPGSQPRRPPPRQRTSSSGRLRDPRAEASDGRWLVCGACGGGSKGRSTAGAAGRRRRGVQELEQSGHAQKNCSQEIGFEDERVESRPLNTRAC
jgi:hypothetical protein